MISVAIALLYFILLLFQLLVLSLNISNFNLFMTIPPLMMMLLLFLTAARSAIEEELRKKTGLLFGTLVGHGFAESYWETTTPNGVVSLAAGYTVILMAVVVLIQIILLVMYTAPTEHDSRLRYGIIVNSILVFFLISLYNPILSYQNLIFQLFSYLLLILPILYLSLQLENYGRPEEQQLDPDDLLWRQYKGDEADQ